MAKKIIEEKEQEEEVKVSSNSLLGDSLKEFKGDHHNMTKRVSWKVSTGSLKLDIATGGVEPSLWRLCGQNNSGKTPQMLEIVRNILRDVPKSKALWVIAEGRGLSKENRERCGLKFVSDPKEWDIGTVFVLESNIFELFIKIVRDLVKNNEEGIHYAFVVDSVDGLQLRDDALKEITESNRVAGVPMLAKKMLQSLSLGMFKYGHWMGLISQVTAEIKLDQYAPSANRGGNFSGGNSLLHGPDVIIQYERSFAGDFLLDNPKGKLNDGTSKPIGQNVKVTLIKSILEATRRTTVTYPIRYGRKPSGIWIEREIGEIMTEWGLASDETWIKIAPTLIKELKEAGIEVPEKIQGKNNLYKMFEENEAARDYMFKSIVERLKR